MNDDLKILIKGIVLILLAVFIIIWAATAFVYSVHNVPIKVYVKNKLVYDGRDACCEVISAGYATTVNITGGWYCMFPKESYTDKDVRVETARVR